MVRSLSCDVQAFASPLASAGRYYALCCRLRSWSACCHGPPRFRASSTGGHRMKPSPNKGRSFSRCCHRPSEHVICPHPSARSTSANSSGSVSLSAASWCPLWVAPRRACSVGLNRISVRHLMGLGENVADDELSEQLVRLSHCPAARTQADSQLYEHIRGLPLHGRPQLPSPRTVFLRSYIWYTASC